LPQLRLQRGFVFGQRLLEQPALLGVHRLGLGTEFPTSQARQLEGDLLDLEIPDLDLVVLVLDVLQHLLRQYHHRLGREALQVMALQLA
jgi:hypothetical protein